MSFKLDLNKGDFVRWSEVRVRHFGTKCSRVYGL